MPILLVLGAQVLVKSDTQRPTEEEQVVAAYNEVARSILPATKKAIDVIREDTTKVNFWDATIPTVFYGSLHISGIVMAENMILIGPQSCWPRRPNVLLNQ